MKYSKGKTAEKKIITCLPSLSACRTSVHIARPQNHRIANNTYTLHKGSIHFFFFSNLNFIYTKSTIMISIENLQRRDWNQYWTIVFRIWKCKYEGNLNSVAKVNIPENQNKKHFLILLQCVLIFKYLIEQS